MQTARSGGIEGRLFPLCSKTVFRLTLDESMKNPPTVQGHVEAEVLPSTHRRLYSITYHHLSKSTLQCSTDSSYKMTLSHPFLVLPIAETVIQVAESWLWGAQSSELGRSLQPE